MANQKLYSRSILILKLESLDEIIRYAEPIEKATAATESCLLVLVLCDIFNASSGLSHTGSWDAIQRLLSFAYVEATRIAYKHKRILLDVDVLLDGVDEVARLPEDDWQHVFYAGASLSTLLLGEQLRALHSTSLNSGVKQFNPSELHSGDEIARKDLPSTFPVIALGGTFDHLHSGHKILLSMSAWIANEKVIVGVTDDNLLQKKQNKDLLEPIDTRINRTKAFLQLFKPGLVYDVVPINDVYGPTAYDENIQALVVSKETLGGAAAIKHIRSEKGLQELECFVIDVISTTSSSLAFESMDMLRQAKMSSTFIREWLAARKNREEGIVEDGADRREDEK